MLSKIFGNRNDRFVKSLQKIVKQINSLEKTYEVMSDDELRGQTNLFKDRLNRGDTLDMLLPDAFSVVREASKRVLKMRHFDVQMVGGIVLHKGMLAEMKTGEGKTLVSTLPIYLNALTGEGVHVVTVNDYLAQRDAQWMGEIYEFLDLRVGCIHNSMDDLARQRAYECDITYGTNNEFGFDYLRDNMKFASEEQVQRGHHFAIVDEVDSILVDEARTPLIISGPADDSSELYLKINPLLLDLKEDHYEKEEKNKNIVLTDEGMEYAENWLTKQGLLSNGSLYDVQNISLVHHVNQALKAHKMYTREVDYIVTDQKKVVIVDEFTGRMMEGRRYSDGLHQALEAKEGVRIQRENQTLASVTFQNYFRLYKKLSGMAGTAATEAQEFMEIYELDVITIPTNKPCIRDDMDDEIYRTAAEKQQAIAEIVKECVKRGQPVLVGTASIESSEAFSRVFKSHSIKHNVLNARHHEQEAYIIAQAGRPGVVTIATNMAGRGTDIQLGGHVDMLIEAEQSDKLSADSIRARCKEEHDQALNAGGLYIVGTERHESRRIDNQLRGRSGRQGDPGASKFFLSLEDNLMRIFGSDRMDGLLQKLGMKQGEAIVHRWINRAIEKAQQRVEAHHFEIRKHLLKYDDVMNEQRKIIYELRSDVMAADDVQDMVHDMALEVIEGVVTRAFAQQTPEERFDVLHTACLQELNLDVPNWFDDQPSESWMVSKIHGLLKDLLAKKTIETSVEFMRMAEKNLLLQILDHLWKDHLLSIDHLREGIGLRAYGQKDPLNEYKKEAFDLFESLLYRLNAQVVEVLSHVSFSSEELIPEPHSDLNDKDLTLSTDKEGDETEDAGQSRNALCSCGSGKKYKRCCGAT
jgi:preprotein translocase subunit SecA